jgi:hypothetical protein
MVRNADLDSDGPGRRLLRRSAEGVCQPPQPPILVEAGRVNVASGPARGLAAGPPVLGAAMLYGMCGGRTHPTSH